MRKFLAPAALLFATSGCGGSEPRVAEIDIPVRTAAPAQRATAPTSEVRASGPSSSAEASPTSPPDTPGASSTVASPAPDGNLAASSVRPTGPAAAAPGPRRSALASAALSGTRTPLLGGRLTARLPRAAEPMSLGEATPHAPVLESRHRFVVGQSRLVLQSVELLASSDGDLEAGVHADVSRWRDRPASFEVQRLDGRGRLEVVQVIPTVPATTPPAGPDSLCLASALYVVSLDETVQRLALFADAATSRDVAGVKSLVRRIAETLAPGGQPLARSDGTSRFTVFARGPELRIETHRSVAFETRAQDSETYSILPIRGLGDHGGRIDVTVTGRTDPYPRRVRRVPGRLLGKAMQWRAYDTESGRELRFTHDALSEGFYLDVRIQGPDRRAVEELRSTAESLQMSSPCESPRQCGPGESCRASYCRTVGGGTAVARTLDALDL